MKFTQSDFDEATELATLTIKMNDIDAAYVDAITDEIAEKQPFFLSVMLGYKYDTTIQELDEILRVFFLIWEYFKLYGRIPPYKVTQEEYETVELNNFKLLQSLEAEKDPEKISTIYERYFAPLKSKSLLAAVLFRFNHRQAFIEMSPNLRGMIFIEMKCFIEFFESSSPNHSIEN
jgi:hypothetical protein